MHALQNHDELTYELVHFAIAHKDDIFNFRGSALTGAELAVTIRGELIERLTGEAGPYNSTFTTNGIASTTATVITATLGVTDLSNLNRQLVERVKRGHLLLAMFNAFQPGVFAFSGWDLCGMLTLERSQAPWLLATGDTRWINRGAYDLMGYQPHATESKSGMPHHRLDRGRVGDDAGAAQGPQLFRLAAVRRSRAASAIRPRDQCSS